MRRFETEVDKYFKQAVNLVGQDGSVDTALEFANAIKDEDYRDGALAKLARFFAGQREPDKALPFCDGIHRPLEKADALFDIAHKLREEGLFEAAKTFLTRSIETASKIDSKNSNLQALLLQISVELFELGEEPQALELLRRTIQLAEHSQPGFEFSKTLRGCARALAQWNHVGEAVEVARRIQWPELRKMTLEELKNPLS